MEQRRCWGGRCAGLGMERSFVGLGSAAVPGMWNRAEFSCADLQLWWICSSSPAGRLEPESCSPNPPTGQHVEMMFGVMDVLPFPVSQPTLHVKPGWKIQDALRHQRDE